MKGNHSLAGLCFHMSQFLGFQNKTSHRQIYSITVNTAFINRSPTAARSTCGCVCECVRACREEEVWAQARAPLPSAASWQPSVVYDRSCPLWVCLWIPIEQRIMATSRKACQKQHLHHCTLACFSHKSARYLCFQRKKKKKFS